MPFFHITIAINEKQRYLISFRELSHGYRMIKQIKRAQDIDLGGKIIAMGHRLERTITSLFPKLVRKTM